MPGAVWSRRGVLAAAGMAPIAVASASWAEDADRLTEFLNDGGFNFERLTAAAEALSAGDLRHPRRRAPAFARNLSYDDYRRIEFRRDLALWSAREGQFRAELAHAGWLYEEPVVVLEAAEGRVRPIAFDPDLFRYHDAAVESAARASGGEVGYSGVKLLAELNRPGKWDETIVFQGASYFRALGRNSVYGLSARGLALDTGAPSGEQFPHFTALVLERPSEASAIAHVYALLESEAVNGAYRFAITPGLTTRVDVEARLFPRRNASVLGVAPLTSMFDYAENNRAGVDDFRPELHDSDGLLLKTGAGEIIWRPLNNPRDLQVSSFVDFNPQGFGLLQRDRDFAHYQDLEARYDRRPSCWVEPLGSWGPGAVRLVEIPTRGEYNDNVVAFWAPEGGLRADTPLALSYRLHWGDAPGPVYDAGRAVSTHTGTPGSGARSVSPDARRFEIEFDGGVLANLPAESPLQAVATSNGAEILHAAARPSPTEGRWRASIEARRPGARAADLRCFLKLEGQALTETWSYLWT